jgi:hypothetical protein
MFLTAQKYPPRSWQKDTDGQEYLGIYMVGGISLDYCGIRACYEPCNTSVFNTFQIHHWIITLHFDTLNTEPLSASVDDLHTGYIEIESERKMHGWIYIVVEGEKYIMDVGTLKHGLRVTSSWRLKDKNKVSILSSNTGRRTSEKCLSYSIKKTPGVIQITLTPFSIRRCKSLNSLTFKAQTVVFRYPQI